MLADHEHCEVCPLTKDQHKAAEAGGTVRHRFSTDGSLVVVETPSAAEPQPRGGQSVVVAPAPDLMLRRLLLEVGVITQEQFERLFVGKLPSDDH